MCTCNESNGARCWSGRIQLAHLTPADPGEEAAALGALALARVAPDKPAAAAHIAAPLYQLRCAQHGSQVALMHELLFDSKYRLL